MLCEPFLIEYFATFAHLMKTLASHMVSFLLQTLGPLSLCIADFYEHVSQVLEMTNQSLMWQFSTSNFISLLGAWLEKKKKKKAELLANNSYHFNAGHTDKSDTWSRHNFLNEFKSIMNMIDKLDMLCFE